MGISSADWGDLLTAQAGNGNIVNDGTRRFVYDAFNRVKEVYKEDSQNPGEFTVKIAEYTYDALGRRIRKKITGGGLPTGLSDTTVDYLYDGVQCIEERDGSNNVKRQYVWGQYVDELIQQREIDGESETDYYLLSDLLYRAAALTDYEGAIVETYDCDAYGNTIAFSAASGGDWWSDNATTTSDPTCQFIFTGRRFDPETSDATTQMYFYRARYYSPTLGRFISRDPIGYAGGMNLYEYVGGMAVDAVDPMGIYIPRDNGGRDGRIVDELREVREEESEVPGMSNEDMADLRRLARKPDLSDLEREQRRALKEKLDELARKAREDYEKRREERWKRCAEEDRKRLAKKKLVGPDGRPLGEEKPPVDLLRPLLPEDRGPRPTTRPTSQPKRTPEEKAAAAARQKARRLRRHQRRAKQKNSPTTKPCDQ